MKDIVTELEHLFKAGIRSSGGETNSFSCALNFMQQSKTSNSLEPACHIEVTTDYIGLFDATDTLVAAGKTKNVAKNVIGLIATYDSGNTYGISVLNAFVENLERTKNIKEELTINPQDKRWGACVSSASELTARQKDILNGQENSTLKKLNDFALEQKTVVVDDEGINNRVGEMRDKFLQANTTNRKKM